MPNPRYHSEDTSWTGCGCWRYWLSMAYALWEPFLCMSMCIGLIYVFRRYANRQGRLASFLSRNAYTAYLIHEVVIIAIAYAVAGCCALSVAQVGRDGAGGCPAMFWA